MMRCSDSTLKRARTSSSLSLSMIVVVVVVFICYFVRFFISSYFKSINYQCNLPGQNLSIRFCQ